MTKEKLHEAVNVLKNETQEALQLIWDATNKGQRNKLLKNPEIAELLARYDIIITEEVNN